MKFSASALSSFALCLVGADAWWQPAASTSWQIVLSQPLKNRSLDVTAFDFDLFDNTAATIKSLHDDGRKAICYFSAGSWEKWRKDAKDFNKADLGKPLDGWPGERWLNIRSDAVRKIMQQRMDLAVQKGCDAIDPDNMDSYDNGGGGFGLTKADSIDYAKFLAVEGHKRGLAVGLKNAGAIIPSVLSDFDFSVNEQCFQYNECQTFRPFINANKPVFHIEYVKGTPPSSTVNKICSSASTSGFSTVVKHMNLDDWVVYCPDSNAPSTQSHNSGSSAASPTLRSRKTNDPDNAGNLASKFSIFYLLCATVIGLGFVF